MSISALASGAEFRMKFSNGWSDTVQEQIPSWGWNTKTWRAQVFNTAGSPVCISNSALAGFKISYITNATWPNSPDNWDLRYFKATDSATGQIYNANSTGVSHRFTVSSSRRDVYMRADGRSPYLVSHQPLICGTGFVGATFVDPQGPADLVKVEARYGPRVNTLHSDGAGRFSGAVLNDRSAPADLPNWTVYLVATDRNGNSSWTPITRCAMP